MPRLLPHLSFILLAIGATHCGGKQPRIVQQVAQVDKARCEFLAPILGTSMVGGSGSYLGADNAVNDALMQAERGGATHIVWIDIVSNHSGSSASGRAYRCR